MHKKIVFVFLGILLFVLARCAYCKNEDPAPAPAPTASVSAPIEGTQDTMEFPAALVGEQFEYAVQRGDSLTSISARFGIELSVLARMNGIKKGAMLQQDQLLQIDNRHIIPERLTDGILINLPQRMLYYFQAGKLMVYYPVGLGRPNWPTPMGSFSVINIQENKTWYLPKSIQEEMRREGKIVLTQVPPGPENPLGKHWIGLSLPGIGIHGTIAPASIYHFLSHGCIRLHPDDIAALFQQVRKNLTGKLIYVPVLLVRLKDGRVFLEVNRDVYKKNIDPITIVENSAKTQGIGDMVDWDKVKEVIQLKEGLAREVGLPVPIPNGDIQ
ncbi:L,D-transpeptidase family protein [Candidatus Nitrotoga sp. 1052]|uniref:L,D-transpeptidase family protein n=1 Tax=Candidatus Nitrotoga sp. 1052 TaxID=2886964 RepID=UPI001EF67A30|nr:L,D-transpeptidase family protein [Candidatus Nitrotoga sp. 1052]CAH1078882.1 ErfK/YbiS/YcfS/YnhG family protein [Candidatus Nitrotoga sp. 1052]